MLRSNQSWGTHTSIQKRLNLPNNRILNRGKMSEYDYSTSEPDEESLNLRIEETATEVSGMETGTSQSPVRNSRPKKKKRIIRPMSLSLSPF